MRRMVAVMACVVALAGCNGEGDDPTPSVAPSTVSPTETATPVPTVTPTPTPTVEPTPTPTAAARPWTVDLSGVVDDGEVTIEEAQQIIDAQDALINSALIPFLTSEPKPEIIPRSLARAYLAVYPDDLSDILLGLWRQPLANGFENTNTVDPDGYRKTVLEVRGADASCISLRVEQDFSGLALEPRVVEQFIELQPLGEPKLANNTGWIRTDESNDPAPVGISCLG